VAAYAWSSAEAFLADWREDHARLPRAGRAHGGMSGLELFDLLCERGNRTCR
jgi:hypothetical protein